MAKKPGLPKEAVLHAQRDTANLPVERTTVESVVRHAQADMANLPPESPGITDKAPGFLDRAADAVGQAWEGLRIGDEHAKSMLKLGGHELTQVLAAFPDSNIRPMEEPGVFGNEAMPHIQEHGLDYQASRGQGKDRSRSR